MPKKIIPPDWAKAWRRQQFLERKLIEKDKEIDDLKWRLKQLRFQIYQMGGVPKHEAKLIKEYGEV